MQIQLFAILLLLQGFSTCHPAQEPPGALKASLNYSPAASSEKTLPEMAQLAYQSDDSGATWQDISAGLPADFQTTCMIVVEGTVYLGSEKGLYQHRRYCNAGRQWEPELLLQDRVTNLCPGRSGFYTCNYGLGVFQNVMGTGIWAPITAALEDKTVHTILEIDGSLLVGTDNGIFKSADGGRSWKQVFAGKMVVELVAAGEVLLGGGLQGIIRSTDGGENWAWSLTENKLAKKIATSEGSITTILGFNNRQGLAPESIASRLRSSADGGQTWQQPQKAGPDFCLKNGLVQAGNLYDLVQTSTHLYASFDSGVFRSADGGISWDCVFPTDGKTIFRIATFGQKLYAVKGFVGC